MISVDNAAMLSDRGEVVGSDGDTIGKVGQVYVDNQTGSLSWVTVKTGFFGMSESFVPLDNATSNGNVITVPYDKAKVKDAPNHEPGEELSMQEEEQLYSYYGVQHGAMMAGQVTTGVAGTDTELTSTENPVDYDTARTNSASGDASVTRSEEQLRVGTEKTESGRARLHKFVVTEQQSVNVPVSHDEAHIVREPIQGGEATNATIGEDSIEVPLMSEEVHVSKDTVAVEKVGLQTDTVTEDRQVTESVRKEQVEIDDSTAIVAGEFGTDRKTRE